MSNDDIFEFQESVMKAYEEQKEDEESKENQEADDFGFGEVLAQRKEKKDALRKRFHEYYLKYKKLKEVCRNEIKT